MKFRLVAKTVLIMKLTAVLILATCLQVAAKGYGQGRISLHVNNASILSVVKEIARQAGYKYILNEQWAGKMKPVTIDTSNITVEEALDKCFVGQPYTYAIVNSTILVKERGTGDTSHPAFPYKLIKAQGVVYNEAGQPLPGANVTIKESGKGTITNAEGKFELPAVPEESPLVISFIGYATQLIKVNEGKVMQVYLTVAKNELDKVVVQAYGTTTQRLATGNIGVVRAEDIAKQPVINPLDAVQGQIAGAIVTNTSGYTSATVKVEIRGRNTINPNFPSDPLYIIDGVPLTILELTPASSYNGGSQGVIQSGIYSPANGQSPFFSINPSDIESIEVLKDADATAIYGSRGSNGVILITTKKGKTGKTKFDLNVYDGISQTPRYYDMLNTRQYVEMRKEALANDGLPLDIYNAPDLVVWDTTKYTDWQKYLWGGLGRQINAEASLSGGDSRTAFRIGSGYLHETEIMTLNGANQRGSVSLNINHKSLNQRLNIGLTAGYSIATSNQINIPGAITLAPNAPPIFDSKGNLNYAGWAPLNGLFAFGSILQPYTSKTNFLNSNLTLSYEVLKGLVLRTNFGYNNIISNQTNLSPIAAQDPSQGPLGNSSLGITFIRNLIVEPQIEYNSFIIKGKLDLLIGASTQSNSTTSDYLSGSGYANDALLTSIINAPVQFSANYGAEYKYSALFTRFNYNWRNKYILSLNGRRDGSSKFGPGRQFGNFGSIGAAWVFSEESLIKHNIPILSFGKLRGSYGTVGGDQIGNYQYLSQWQYGRGLYNNQLPLASIGHTDSLLQWQVNRKAEIALDLGILKDKINITVVWYRNRTNNQLVSFPTPAFTGFTSVTANSPADVENKGWEFNLTSKIFDKSDFKWWIKFNIGINRNKLLGYPNLSLSPYAGTYFIGRSLNVKRLLHYTGIDLQTGGYSFEDKNHDGQITYDQSGKTSDDSYLYDLSPRYDGGFSSNLSFKRWELNIFFYFKKQLGFNIYASLDPQGDMTNQPSAVLNHWQKPGDIATFPRFTTIPPMSFPNYSGFSDGILGDASFIRLQNLSLSYSLPTQILRKIGVDNFRLFLQGRNLFFITKYQGLDPSIFSFNAPPIPRTIVTGISCTF